MKGLKRVVLKRFLIAFLVLLSPLISTSQDLGLESVTGTYVLKNVNIVQAPGRKIDLGMVVIKNGVIKSVGKTAVIPADARIIDADSMFVYAGFIDGLSHAGIPKPADQDRVRLKDPGNPPNDVAGIQPHLDVRDMLDHKDKSLKDLRSAGFTVAHTVPYGRMLPGNGAIILLSGNSADDLVLKDHTSMFSQLKGASGMYPATVIGVMAKYRELYKQANLAKNDNAQYAVSSSGLERPSSDRILEAFYPVIDQKIPVAFSAENVLDIQRVLTLRKDLGFKLLLGEVKQGWDITKQLKSSGTQVFLSLDLPEWKEEEPDTTAKEKTMFALEQERLDNRKNEIIKKYYQQPLVFKSQGIPFGFSTMGVKSKDIKSTLVKLVAKGLSADDALAALTTTPAKILGVSGMMGTVDVGKMANLIVTDKPYFEEKSQLRYVFVDGEIHTVEAKKNKKAKSTDKVVDVSGQWSYAAETPQGTSSGKIKITGEPGNYSGTITSNFNEGEMDLTSITVDGSTIEFTFNIDAGGSSLTIEVNAEIEGDEFEGTMTAGQFGSFPVEGQKTPKQ